MGGRGLTMTATGSLTHQAVVDEAQVLFEEARQRRKRRRLIGGTTALVLVIIVAIAIALLATGSSGTRQDTHTAPTPLTGAVIAGSTFSIRPVLCYAPPYAVAVGQAAPSGPLPRCSASSQLTVANLRVTPNASNVNGYTANSNISPDAQFGPYPSTSVSKVGPDATVLLPGTPANGSGRYVLGPAGFSRSGIAAASALRMDGQWSIDLTLTGRGSAQWDALARKQFHAVLGIVIDGRVLSDPITQPTQSSFTSFHGQLQIGGFSTEHQARAVASEL
jgi:hypothetical protein